MSHLDLSPQEKSLVFAIANDRNGPVSRLSFYASALVPVAAFGIYGIAERDLPALILGFVGLSIFVGWRINRELSVLVTYRAIFAKIATHEREVGG